MSLFVFFQFLEMLLPHLFVGVGDYHDLWGDQTAVRSLSGGRGGTAESVSCLLGEANELIATVLGGLAAADKQDARGRSSGSFTCRVARVSADVEFSRWSAAHSFCIYLRAKVRC